MGVSLQHIASLYDEWLQPTTFQDYCHNGFQVRGDEEPSELVFALDGTPELFENAQEGALLIVHHGIIWGKVNRIGRDLHRRLEVLLRKRQTLLAMHLPLDHHPKYGTAAAVAARLGLVQLEPFGHQGGQSYGLRGKLAEPLPPEEFLDLVRGQLTAPKAQLVSGGDHPIGDVGVVTGGGTGFFGEAIDAGCDAFLTGEDKYEVWYPAKENHAHFIHAGHYWTEIWGVRRLMDFTQDAFPEAPCRLFEAPCDL